MKIVLVVVIDYQKEIYHHNLCIIITVIVHSHTHIDYYYYRSESSL